MKFKSNIELQSGLEDNNATSGTSGQVLSSTGTGVEWIDQSAITEAKSNFVYFDVKNETGSTINKGKGVMAVGTDGNSGHILIDEMAADGSIEPKYFLGVLETTVANGGFARVISFGQLDQFNTNGQNGETWNDGNILWCDPDSAGDFTITEPDGPNVKIAAAIVLNASTNGKIQVRVQANEGIHDLHDTKIVTQTDGDVLVWKDEDSVWQNDSTLNVDYTNGRVGIGTTSPSTTLDVSGTTNSTYFTTGGAEIYGDAFSGLNLRCPSGIANDFSLVGSAGIGPNIMTVPAASTNVIFYGNVGINNTNPSERLDVSGNIKLSETAATSDTDKFVVLDSGVLKYRTGSQVLSDIGAQSALTNPVTGTGIANYLPKFTGSTSLGNSLVYDDGINVGINNTSPGSTLDVNGNILLSDPSFSSTRGLSSVLGNLINFDAGTFKMTIGSGQMVHDILNGQLSLAVNGGSNFFSHSTITGATTFYNSGESMRIDGNNNVGIGTTNPASKLHAYESSSNTNASAGITVEQAGSGDAVVQYLLSFQKRWVTGIDNSDSDKFKISQDTDLGVNTVMTFDSSSRVGIGTTSPDSKLEVASTDSNTYLHVRNDSTGSTRLKMSNSSDTNSNGFQIINNASNGQVNLLNYKASTLALWTNSSQRMTILSGGNVGIGTTSPQTKLHVANGTLRTWSPTSGTTAIFESTASSRSFVTITGANESELWFGDGTTQAKGRVRYENNNNTMELWTNAVPRVNIDSSGNVGIGTTLPEYELDVTGDGRVTGDFRCDTLIQTSDAALKDNIRDISLAKSNIRFKEYTLKNDNSGKKKYGVLADDIKNDYPELVYYNEKGEAGVDYTSLLVKKVAELEATEKTMLTWRHYIGNTSYNTLYDSGATTAFPYAYSSIPAPYDMYLTSVTIVNNPYSTYNKGPLGGKAQLLAYENGSFIDKVADVAYDQKPYASVTFDFADKVFIRQGNALQLRFQADGNWYYCNSTIILTKA